MLSKETIWIIEDDPSSRFVYEEIFSLRYTLKLFTCMKEFKDELSRLDKAPDVLIADLRLPDESFLTFLNSSEFTGKISFPFIVVSSIDDLDALRLCYRKGASDYITKPFGKGELIVKVERLLGVQDNGPEDGPFFSLDPKTLTVSRRGVTSGPLTSKEFQLLAILNEATDNTLTRDEIITQIWGKVTVTSKTLDVHLSNLRKKLERLGLEVIHVAPNSYRIV